MEEPSTTKLKIAICGGGIASLCLAHALTTRHNAQWEVKIFEASPTLREESAAIGLGSNAQEALAMISPNLRKAVDEAGGVRMNPSTRIMMGTGQHQARHVGDISPAVPQIIVHRGSFWRALRKHVPENVLQLGKKLTGIEAPDDGQHGPVRLSFSDGTAHEVDALVGCDGINSITRQAVLRDHPSAKAVYTKGYGHRTVVPMEVARSVFGEDYCLIHSQHGWIGHNALLITDIIDNGASMQCIIGGLSLEEVWPYDSPWVPWPKADLEQKLKDWGTFGGSMLKIFTDQETLYAAGSRIHLETPTFCRGPVCLAGDAAQTFLPTQAAGAGQAIEDSLMLSNVLGSCSKASDIERALVTYDALRRPRRQDIAKSSARAALILTGKLPGVEMEPARIAETLPDWGANIYDYDLVAAQAHALRQMAPS